MKKQYICWSIVRGLVDLKKAKVSNRIEGTLFDVSVMEEELVNLGAPRLLDCYSEIRKELFKFGIECKERARLKFWSWID